MVIFLFKFGWQHNQWLRCWTAFWSPKGKARKREWQVVDIRGLGGNVKMVYSLREEYLGAINWRSKTATILYGR